MLEISKFSINAPQAFQVCLVDLPLYLDIKNKANLAATMQVTQYPSHKKHRKKHHSNKLILPNTFQ